MKKRNKNDVKDLSGLNLSKRFMPSAKLDEADLSGTNLRSANLNHTDLTNANLRNADLSNSNMIGADISGADLTEARIKNALLYGVKFDEETQLPFPIETAINKGMVYQSSA